MLKRFATAIGGNISIMFAMSAVPVLFALGAASDYGFAVKTRSMMDAAADAAALAAVTPAAMSQTTVQAQTLALNMFATQVSSLPRLTFNVNDVAQLNIAVNDALVNNQRVRTAVVQYKAQSVTAFTNILRMPTIAIGGSSTATASTSPNIDFYLLLDTSPSMAIPSTTNGIAQMVKLTPYQGNGAGCAFACHETSPSIESGSASYKQPIFGNPGCPDDPNQGKGPCLDNYQLAINNSIPLRITLVNQAVQNLVSTAQSTAAATGAAYQLAGYTFDDNVKQAFALQAPTQQTINQAQANINMLVVDHENSDNGDQNTVFDSSSDTTVGAFPQILAAMNSAYGNKGAGTGTNTAGDRPQQVMMLVTDGVSDEPYSGSRIYNPVGGATNTSSNINSLCTKIKANTNIRIAVLYLVYNPLPMTDGKKNPSWYALNVAPLQNNIAPTLQSCASSPGLFYQVNTNGDISAAMSALFQSAVKSAHLTN